MHKLVRGSHPQARLKHLAHLEAGGTPRVEDPRNWADEQDGVPWVSIRDMSAGTHVARTERYVSEGGLRAARLMVTDPPILLFSMYASLGQTALLQCRGCWNQAILGIVPGPNVDERFLHYALAAVRPYLMQLARSNTQHNLNQEQVGNLLVPNPLLRVQRLVADFLDRETARIEGLVTRKRRLLGLLEEHRVSTLTDLVTGRLSDEPRLASGHQLIPEHPKSWRVVELRRLECEVQSGPFGSQLHADEYVSNRYPVVNPANLIDGRIQPDPSITVDAETRKRLSRHVLDAGDVVFGRRGELGRAGLATEREAGWVCGTGCLRVRFLRESFEPRYLRHYLRLPLVKQYFESVAVGSTMSNLNSDIALGLPVPLPPFDEQARIADEADQIDERSRSLTEGIERQLALLEERRQALITAAVTGDLQVQRAS